MLDIKFVGRTSRGHTGEGHIRFIIHLSAVRASIFIFFVLLVVVVVDYRLYLQHHLFCFHSRGTSIL